MAKQKEKVPSDARGSEENSEATSSLFSLADPNLTFLDVLKYYERAAADERAGIVGSVNDAFFKSTIGGPGIGGDFMASHLPEFAEIFAFEESVSETTELVLPSQRQVRSDYTFWVPHRRELASGALPKSKKEFLRICVPVTFILEHKAQSGALEDPHTVAQLGLYAHMNCYQQVARRLQPYRQPFPVVVYNGPDPNVGPFFFENYFPVDKALARWGIHWEMYCVNLTRLYLEGKLLGNPITRSMCLAMGASGAGTLRRDFALAFEQLKELREWDDPFNRQYSRSLATFCKQDLQNKGFALSWEELDDAMARAVPDIVRKEMKTLLEEYSEERAIKSRREGELKGKLEGKLEERIDVISEELEERYGSESNVLLRKIKNVTDLNVLKSIYRLVARSEILEQIERGVDEILAANPGATRPFEEVLRERGIE
ncbi:MAG: hypothetical protein IJM30_12700 [Thermoguttaceae bacterium]|nr:hypothetical protein [Thermoguttaceae bacterium]